MAGKWPSHRVAPEKPQSGGGTGIQGGAESLARGPVGTAGQGGAWPLQLVKTGPQSGFGTRECPTWARTAADSSGLRPAAPGLGCTWPYSVC